MVSGLGKGLAGRSPQFPDACLETVGYNGSPDTWVGGGGVGSAKLLDNPAECLQKRC